MTYKCLTNVYGHAFKILQGHWNESAPLIKGKISRNDNTLTAYRLSNDVVTRGCEFSKQQETSKLLQKSYYSNSQDV